MSVIGLSLLIIAHAFDYGTFLVMVTRHGLDAELNPFAVSIMQDYGLEALAMTKFAAVLLVAATFLIVGRKRPRLAGGVLACGIFVGGFGAYTNILTI
jgi:hypothetical protein